MKYRLILGKKEDGMDVLTRISHKRNKGNEDPWCFTVQCLSLVPTSTDTKQVQM